MGVSVNGGFPPQILHWKIGISIINHPFWATPIFGNNHIIVSLVSFITTYSQRTTYLPALNKTPDASGALLLYKLKASQICFKFVSKGSGTLFLGENLGTSNRRIQWDHNFSLWNKWLHCDQPIRKMPSFSKFSWKSRSKQRDGSRPPCLWLLAWGSIGTSKADKVDFEWRPLKLLDVPDGPLSEICTSCKEE